MSIAADSRGQDMGGMQQRQQPTGGGGSGGSGMGEGAGGGVGNADGGGGGLRGLRVGDRVRVRQRMMFGLKPIETTVEGEVMRFGQQKTGSWFAHGSDDKLWLDRVELRKSDGELVMLNLDRNSVVEVVG